MPRVPACKVCKCTSKNQTVFSHIDWRNCPFVGYKVFYTHGPSVKFMRSYFKWHIAARLCPPAMNAKRLAKMNSLSAQEYADLIQCPEGPAVCEEGKYPAVYSGQPPLPSVAMEYKWAWDKLVEREKQLRMRGLTEAPELLMKLKAVEKTDDAFVYRRTDDGQLGDLYEEIGDPLMSVAPTGTFGLDEQHAKNAAARIKPIIDGMGWGRKKKSRGSGANSSKKGGNREDETVGKMNQGEDETVKKVYRELCAKGH